MKAIKFNESWKVWKEQDSFALVWDIPQQAKEVTLPHDAMIEEVAYKDSVNKGNTGFRDGGVYHYVKLVTFSPEEEEQTLILKFEGVYQHAFVYINGQLAGKDHFGYNTFFVPINDFIKMGQENEIRVIVRNSATTNSRWYSGSGIYRDVYLLMGQETYIKPQGVKITTEALVGNSAIINIKTQINNQKNKRNQVILHTRIFDEKEGLVGEDVTPLHLFAGEEKEIQHRLEIEQANLWSDTTPNLYTCLTTLEEGLVDEEIGIKNYSKQRTEIDRHQESFGLRTLSLSAKQGLRVNGNEVKLRGACIHHDSGLLGAATFIDSQYRQISKLKEAGFNAIRMAHQPIAPAMLSACDALGMYVMDETFDMWTRGKSDFDYSVSFLDHWKEDTLAMVNKDYNHPCVILYSIGNEIPEIGTDFGAQLANDISQFIRSLDATRYTLASINGVFASGDAIPKIMEDLCDELAKKGELKGNVNNFMTLLDAHLDQIVVHPEITKRLEKACAATDIAGYNYMTARYEDDSKAYPNRIIVGSETYPPEIARNWKEVKDRSNVIGDFTWTGWDYIGEAGVGVPAYQWGEGGFGASYPCQLAYCGDMEITGVRRPASYYREIVFGLRDQPFIAVQNPDKYGEHLIKTPWVISDAQSSWTFPGKEGQPVIVEVYANGTHVELLINQVSQGKKPSGSAVDYRVLFETIYESGTVTAVVYEGDQVLSESTLKTTQAPSRIKIEKEVGYDEELLYFSIQIVDENEKDTCSQEKELTLSLSEESNCCVEVAGFGSGDPKTKYGYQSLKTRTFGGKALLILRKKTQSKTVEFTISTDDCIEEKIKFKI